MATTRWLRPWLFVATTTLVLAACGGGGSGGGTNATLPVEPAPAPGIYLLAGGLGGHGCLDATGTAARFDQPEDTTVDSLGNIWVLDACGLRTIDAAGIVKTVAPKYTPDLTPFPTTRFGLIADGYGNVYQFEHRGGHLFSDTTLTEPLSVLNPATPAPDMFAYGRSGCQSGGEPGYGLKGIDRRGAWYCRERFADLPMGGIVKRVAGQPAVRVALYGQSVDGDASTARFSSIDSMTFDVLGNGYFADTQYQSSGGSERLTSIRRLTQEGAITTVLPGYWGSSGVVYTDGVTGVATANSPAELQLDAAGNLYFSDTSLNANGTTVFYIRKLTPSGASSTLAGPFPGQSLDGVATRMVGYVVDSSGAIYHFEQTQLVRIASGGGKSAFAGSLPQPGSVDGAGSLARFDRPLGVTAAAGNVYVADCGNHTVRKIDAGGNTITLAGKAGQPGSEDGVGAAARFICPRGIAADAFGNIYVTHGDSGQNAALRRIDAESGTVTTIAASRGLVATGVAVDADGKVYTNDIPNKAVRVYDPKTQTLVMLGQGKLNFLSSGFGSNFSGIAVDGQGNIYIPDQSGSIRKMDASGNLTNLPGVGTYAYTPGIAVDAAGNVYRTDQGSHVIRKLAPNGTETVVAGANTSYYVKLGSLPGSLGSPVGIALRPSAGGTHLVVSDENSVVSIILP